VSHPPESPAEPDVLVAEEVEDATRTIHVPRYHVILFDDDAHTYEYVIEMLIDTFGHSLERAFRMAQKVDAAGWVVVDTTTRERAQLKRDQIHGYGADWRIDHCKGSMSASVEEAD
jgi:ATP-dependent Clp protease adaptor protein ClpS